MARVDKDDENIAPLGCGSQRRGEFDPEDEEGSAWELSEVDDGECEYDEQAVSWWW